MISSRNIVWQNKKYVEWKICDSKEISFCEDKTKDVDLDEEVEEEPNIPPPPSPQTIPQFWMTFRKI
jgi:endogenous inhibitor of DNA gyrase (YacG/DUF329 family)